MQFSSNFKYIWWVVVMLIVGAFLFLRISIITTGTPQNFDLALLGVGAILLLIPFFSEFTLLGVTLKQKVEETKKELKAEIKEQTHSLRTEFQNIVGINNRYNPSIYVNTPPVPDYQLPALEEQIKLILESSQRELGLISQPSSFKDLMPPEDVLLAFTSRYRLEEKVRRIWNGRFSQLSLTSISSAQYSSSTPFTVRRMTNELVQAQIITPAIEKSIREVYAVVSQVIHGEKPSGEQVKFYKDVVPTLISTLRGIK